LSVGSDLTGSDRHLAVTMLDGMAADEASGEARDA
jgi:hypothetical protein